MPRGKGYRRAQAMRRQRAAQRSVELNLQPPDCVGVRGTGHRHRVRKWPVSPFTGKCCKLVMPDRVPGKQFVLVVGDSHLRSIADGVVQMPAGRLSYGIFSVPGGGGAHLTKDLQHCVLQRSPDAVCILAPGNDVEGRVIGQASADFARLLASVSGRWKKVFVVDFPRRLTVSLELQEQYSQEFHRVAARMGVPYFPTAEHLPVHRTDLWCRDSVHLSDGEGMAVLVELLSTYSQQVLQTTALKAPSPPRTPPSARTFVPEVVVVGDVVVPSPLDPSKWTVIGPGRKRSQPEQDTDSEEDADLDASLESDVFVAEMLQVPKFPLTPSRFNVLPAEDAPRVPVLVEEPAVPKVTKKARVSRRRKTPTSPTDRAEQQVESPRSPTTSGVAVTEEVPPRTRVSPVPSPSPAGTETTQRIKAKDLCFSNACVCVDKLQSPVVSGADHRAAPVAVDDSLSLACSVVAGVRHVISPVCTWRRADVSGVRVEASKLDKVCSSSGHYSVFGKKWEVAVGVPHLTHSQNVAEDGAFCDKLQKDLVSDNMCVLDLNGETCAVIHHNNYFVVVDCGTRNASGLAADYGRSVAVWNTCFNDMMLHVNNLKQSLKARWVSCRSLSVRERVVDSVRTTVDLHTLTFGSLGDAFQCEEVQVAAVGAAASTSSVKEEAGAAAAATSSVTQGEADVGGVALKSSLTCREADVDVKSCETRDCANSDVTGEPIRWFDRSVCGSFHQGDPRFEHGGRQCMAICLAAIAKHTVHSVFSWNTDDLDQVVVLGDRLYTGLYESGAISGSSALLCVPDFPPHFALDGQQFDCQQGEFESGYVEVVDGSLISLAQALEDMLKVYNTCIVTLRSNTCVIIKQDGEFAVVDSHARSACGMLDADGTSVVVYFSRQKDVHAHIRSLANCFGQSKTPFEVAGVRVLCRSASVEPLTCVESSAVGSEVSSDVEFVGEVTVGEMQFDPISKVVCQVLCSKLNVPLVKPAASVSSAVCSLGRPCTKEQIVGDGNCFFRAVSQAVSGSQENHRRLRRLIVGHLKRHAVDYSNMLRRDYSSVVQYISSSKMYCLGSWATEVEIQATADLLGVSVFTYLNDRWLEYKCRNRGLSNQGIYLENCDGKHFETVVCVCPLSSQSCVGHCKVSRGFNVRRAHGTGYEPVVEPVVEAAGEAVVDAAVEDVVVKPVVDEAMNKFSPICTDVAKRLCGVCKLEFQKQGVQAHTVYGSLGSVCKSDEIVDDGNSFFSALSAIISGSVKGHRKIRLAVVKYMQSHDSDMMMLLGDDYVSVEQYLQKSRIKYVGTKATVLEFQAAANALGVDIFICSNAKWCKYSSITTSDEGIYLRQCSDGLFESVVCVHGVDSQLCFGLCTPEISAKTRYMLRRKSLMQAESKMDDSAYSPSPNYCYSKYLKKKDNFRIKMFYNKQDMYRRKLIAVRHFKYHHNPLYKEKKIEFSIGKYRKNVLYRQQLKLANTIRYSQNELFRQKLKLESKIKYSRDELFRQKVKLESKIKYCQDELFREKVKLGSKIKYSQNELHRQNVKSMSSKKYHENPDHKKNILAGNKMRRQQIKDKSKDFDFVMAQFLEKVKYGPDFICCVCYRLLFRNQVLECNRDNYRTKTEMALIADSCISNLYLHTCSEACDVPCLSLESSRGRLWICHTCHNKISKGLVPPECWRNNLLVDPIPSELACLNSLEQHLIALHIPFMKMVALPKGSQQGVHGPVSCVPANIVQTSNLLPRSDMEGSMLQVKLKRKLTYKGHYEYQYVDTMRVKEALLYLKNSNVYYKDVMFNDEWINNLSRNPDSVPVEEDTRMETSADELEEEKDASEEPAAEVLDGDTVITSAEDELLHDRQQHCMFQDTVLYPVDIGQEALDQYFEDILNVAPAEGNSPVRLLSDRTNEAKCFPVLFPTGCSTYHDRRQHHLTLSRYFNNRILHVDGRFAHNVEYIFFAQYMSEVQQVVANVSIALRKGKGGSKTRKISSNDLNNEESLKNLLEHDDGFRFLKPIRGTPSFWQGAQRDLVACVRQLGIPTWFASFSSADLRWQNLLQTILRQEGRTQTAEELEWADRCNLLRRNPVTAARMFDFRWHCFLREVLMSPSNPIGKIKDYFYRVEFQQRGSPHVHCLFWIEDAPIIDKATDEEVVEFIDRYVTCEIPSDDEQLKDIVTSVQQHSKRHSKTCKKNKTVCRFNFPRPASLNTFVCRELSQEYVCTCQRNEEGELLYVAYCSCGDKHAQLIKWKREAARKVMGEIKKALSDESHGFTSLEQLYESVGIDQRIFEGSYNALARKTSVVLKRQLDQVWINQYSRKLLKCWNANLDIQFVVDAYACIVYIISYISKAEREMGLLLGNAHKEAKKGNASAKDALKKLGSVYLHNRDVCAQEAVYRLSNMHLKELSRHVAFVPVGDKIVRMSLPLNILKERAASQCLNEGDMWMISGVDRYKNRPDTSEFNDMCIATFVSEYRVLTKNETSEKRIKLKNDYGYILKRTRTQPAVVRYVRFSETKSPELFHQSILQLFLPYRNDVQLKPRGFETFEQFYSDGHVRLADGVLHSVKSIVDSNRRRFEIEADALDEIQERIDREGINEDAWCELCPELESERLECLELRSGEEQAADEHVENIPDLAVSADQVAHLEKRNNIMCRSDGLALLRSLNETQMSIFYQVRQWCLEKVMGKNPDPLRVFITGGAGTGKSHLIKAIQYEATRLLSPLCHQPDDICVVLTAPTGIAAYNLNATTIHTTFSIGKDVSLPYTPLGEEKLNSLRVKFRSLQIVIVDEISMVDHKLLAYIHGRLRQIKQFGDHSPFGNVCVVAVGDFYQLPPVKGKALYVENVGADLWSSLFKVAELKTIVRQKDQVFAELLNRVRTRSKGLPMLDSDLQILKSCETGEVSSALHIFATNGLVNMHNLRQLNITCPDNVAIEAQDFVNSKKTGKLELMKGHHNHTYNTSLTVCLQLGVGARVMLCKNIDVSDGLVNGVCGTVTHIDFPSDNNKFPHTVFVKFDDDRIGRERRKGCANASAVAMGSTGIEPEEERVTKKGGIRRQFPLKLAWACTVHKVQGITVDEAVVSLERVFSAGQAYVALSRVRTLSGLVIQHFEDKVIYCRDNIKDAITSMTPFLEANLPRYNINAHTFTVFLMNVQGLTAHVADLTLCTQKLQPSCIAVTETWLHAESSLEAVHIDGYSFHSSPRSLCYSSTNPALVALQGQQRGGVGMFCFDTFDILQVPIFNLECVVYSCAERGILIATVYRPPSYPISLFKENLGKLLDWLNPLSNTIAVMGDFNDDIIKSSTVCTYMTKKGCSQIVTQATTEKGTLIDHVYINTSCYDVEAVVVPTYFSDHEGILCCFNSHSEQADCSLNWD